MVKKVNLLEETAKISRHWDPLIVGELNNQHVKLAKVQGDFVWHSHEQEDELFLVQKGTLYIEFRNKTIELKEGEMVVVPRTVEHRPYTKNNEEVWILLFEPAGTINTGEVKNELTRYELKKL